MPCTSDPAVQVFLVFFGQHDGNDALGDIWIARIGRVRPQIVIEIVDFKKDRVTIGFERAKVMFFVWVVGMTEIIEHRDSLDDPVDCFWAKRSNARRHYGDAGSQMLTQVVI